MNCLFAMGMVSAHATAAMAEADAENERRMFMSARRLQLNHLLFTSTREFEWIPSGNKDVHIFYLFWTYLCESSSEFDSLLFRGHFLFIQIHMHIDGFDFESMNCALCRG